MQPDDAIDEGLTGAFVLAASLYFQAANLRTQDEPLRSVLYTLCRDLMAAAEAGRTVTPSWLDLQAGLSDLVHSIGDIASLATINGKAELAEALSEHLRRIEEIGQKKESKGGKNCPL